MLFDYYENMLFFGYFFKKVEKENDGRRCNWKGKENIEYVY